MFSTLAVISGLGILVAVAYTLRAIQKSFYTGEVAEPLKLDRISIPERIGSVMLIVTTLVIGLYPRLLLDIITPVWNSPLMSRLVKGD